MWTEPWLGIVEKKEDAPKHPQTSPHWRYGVSSCTYVIFPSRIGVRIAEYHIKGRNDHFQGTKDQQEVYRAFRFCSFCIICVRIRMIDGFLIIIHLLLYDTHVMLVTYFHIQKTNENTTYSKLNQSWTKQPIQSSDYSTYYHETQVSDSTRNSCDSL